MIRLLLSVFWIRILHQLWYFLCFSEVANATCNRVSFFLIHKLKDDRGFHGHLSNPVVYDGIKEFSVLFVNSFSFAYILNTSILAEYFLCFFAVMGKQESRCFRLTILKYILRLQESVKKPEKEKIYIELNVKLRQLNNMFIIAILLKVFMCTISGVPFEIIYGIKYCYHYENNQIDYVPCKETSVLFFTSRHFHSISYVAGW